MLRHRVLRVAAACLVGCVLLYGAATAALYAAMRQPPETFGRIMSHVPAVAMIALPFRPLWMSARAGHLRVGDLAPDFALPVLHGDRTVTLSDEYRHKPVVLVFGSYTRPPFRSGVPELNRLYEQYRDRVGFFVVYIQEAHPVDLWQVSSNVSDGVLFASPQTSGERVETAQICVVKLAIKMPALVDGIDNRIERAYTGWPDRLYVVGTDGRVSYKSAPGPFGFSTANLEQHLEQMLQSAGGQ
jgi:hypothetical protein